MNSTSYHPSTRPTSGRSTPSSSQNTPSSFKPLTNQAPRSNTATPANDSFANLVSFNAPNPLRSLKNLSLQEQQEAIQEKRKKEGSVEEKSLGSGFAAQDGAFLESLGKGRVTPNRIAAPPSYAGTDEYGGQKLSNAINKPFSGIQGASRQKELGINGNGISALHSCSPVNASNSLGIFSLNGSSHRALGINGGNIREPAYSSISHEISGTHESHPSDLDDDPFGLGSIKVKNVKENKTATSPADEDDILGLLGRPVSEFTSQKEREQDSQEVINSEQSREADQALAELIDMGFSPEKSKEALDITESGSDIQAAVSWLLNQAHKDSQWKSRKHESENSVHDTTQLKSTLQRSPGPIESVSEPAWLRAQNRAKVAQHRQDSGSPVNGDKDPGKIAAELGTNLLKTANSLWKTGTKKLNQAVSERNSDSESSQPKWMKEAKQAEVDSRRPKPKERQSSNSGDAEERDISQRRSSSKPPANVTDEALMLESGDGRLPRNPSKPIRETSSTRTLDASREQSPAFTKPRDQELPRFMQQPRIYDAKARLSRHANEEQASNAYISPARRKKPAPKHSSLEVNILLDTAAASKPPISSPTKPFTKTQSSVLSQSQTSSRSIPQVSPSALHNSTSHRLEGTSAFKRGDYALATTHYTSALSALPPTHPMTIVLLANRALAHLKTGDPKSSIADSQSAVSIIGPSRGALETIDLGGTEGPKEMKIFWGKAMTRQAEALEQLERWSDAAVVWKSCVEAGFGGGTSTAGRDRCEKAAAGPLLQPSRVSKPTLPKKRATNPVQKLSALDELSGYTTRSLFSTTTLAVRQLRKANAEAERLDDEKFALSDQVSARLTRWRVGKEGNLRALLGSLETVLWEGAGWKKVGMGELIMAGKVKVIYMRGIGKVHPDKVGHLFFPSSSFPLKT